MAKTDINLAENSRESAQYFLEHYENTIIPNEPLGDESWMDIVMRGTEFLIQLQKDQNK